jgi:multicomponent Na+:H+ antiporter subunit C
VSPIALIVGVLVTGGVYLILQRGVVRVTLGFVLLGHAVNVLLLSAGGLDRRGVPIIGQSAEPGDPLPQAFVLTAIVIGFGMTAFLLALAFRAGDLFGADDTEAPEEVGEAAGEEPLRHVGEPPADEEPAR